MPNQNSMIPPMRGAQAAPASRNLVFLVRQIRHLDAGQIDSGESHRLNCLADILRLFILPTTAQNRWLETTAEQTI